MQLVAVGGLILQETKEDEFEGKGGWSAGHAPIIYSMNE
jgi:hypothetical protein